MDLVGTNDAFVGCFPDPRAMDLRIVGGVCVECSDRFAWDTDLVS